jgi:hypothetical protein
MPAHPQVSRDVEGGKSGRARLHDAQLGQRDEFMLHCTIVVIVVRSLMRKTTTVTQVSRC